ncbi:MAG: beta-ketoacyl synthase N-terminal-like domain-containing protein [Verrucomicrobia bacterium]|nr:beta-ketoacyl synthase N-terminal-like domain-containing protein [Verrucomicrobiota bacterium]
MATESSKRIFITGTGIVSPLGLDWQANEASFRANQMNVTPVTMFDVSQRFAKTACQVDLPNERLFTKLPRRRDALIDRGTKMLLLAIREALAMAKMPGMQGIDAIIIGTSAGAMSIGQDYFRHARSSPSKLSGQLARIEYYQPHKQLNAIAMEYDWHGPMIVVSNACASGANAIGDAMAMIQTGKARRVLAGGYDAIAELVFSGFDTLRALAPSGIPRPFDAARDGLALGEGAAVMLLESEEAASERGAAAVCQASGYAIATDLHHLTQPDPAGKAAIRTMTGACQMAGISPHQVNYINSHGTGTPYNDVAEASAIRAWAGQAASGIAVSSTKSAMGHLLGGAGAVEAVICAMALRGQWLPASLNVREADPAVSFDLVREFREASVQVALTNSFGFGGTNATLVLKHADAPGSGPAAATSPGSLRILGTGAVSPAGWGAEALAAAVTTKQSPSVTECVRSYFDRDWSCSIYQVPAAPPDRLPKFPRLRRASPITKFSLAAGLEALEKAGFPNGQGAGRLGIVQCMFNGCVQFSGKFYHEVIETPALASPLIFPETVYNAPASHVAAFLGVDGPVTTFIGESSAIIEGISMAHTWLIQGLVDHVLVIGAEECDWVAAEAVSYYHPDLKASEGAGALVVSLQGDGLNLHHQEAYAFHNKAERAKQLKELVNHSHLIGGETGIPVLDASELSAQAGYRSESTPPSQQPRTILGESMGAAGAWQLVLAAELAKKEGHSASVLLPGSLCAAYSAVVG